MRYLVLCGGGSRGAIEVGFAQALWEYGVRFDGIIGSSVGAVNGAVLASGRHPAELAKIWRALRFKDVFRFNWRFLLRGMREPSVFRVGRRITSLLEQLGVRDFESLPIPLAVMATDLSTGAAVVLDSGPLAPAVLASAAIPGLLPPVVLDGRYLVDGSLSADLPIGEAVRRGATEVWAMRCACCAVPRLRFNRLSDIVAQVFGFAVERMVRPEANALRAVRAYVWSLDGNFHVSALDFRQSGELMREAHRVTCERLTQVWRGGSPAPVEQVV